MGDTTEADVLAAIDAADVPERVKATTRLSLANGDGPFDLVLWLEEQGATAEQAEVWEPNYQPSNGTLGDMFRTGPMGCFSCTVDHAQGWHTEPEGGESCPILMRSIVGESTEEWQINRATQETRCTAWRGPCACTEGTTYRPPPASWLEDIDRSPMT